MQQVRLREVSDMSGWCRHSQIHHYCWGSWTTPTARVTCPCPCHSIAVVPQTHQLVAKGDLGHDMARRIVAKK